MEDLTDLEAFIEAHYQHLQSTMNPDQDATQPQPDSERRKRDSATDTSHLQTQEVVVSVLASINEKLDMLVMIHKQLNNMGNSLEYDHNQIKT